MTKRQATLAVATLTVLAAALRVPGLNSALWFDEIVTLVESVRPPFAQVVTAFPGNNNHPFYSLLAHLSVTAFGEHPWTLRLPAFVFGVAGIPALYRLGSALTTRVEAVLATLLLTVAYHDVWFSQNARGYTMLMFFTLVATTLFLRLAERADRWLAIAYGIAVGLGIYTHLTMAFVAVAHAMTWVWLAARQPLERARHLRTGATALGVAGLIASLGYLPMAAEVYRFFSGPPQATAAVATSTWAVLEVLRGLRIGFGAMGALAAFLLLAVGGWSYLRRNVLGVVLFALPGLVTAVALLVLHAPVRPRFFLFLLGFGLLMLVRGSMACGHFLARRLAVPARSVEPASIAVVGAIAVASLWSLGYNYRHPKQDFEGAMQFIEGHRDASDPVGTAGLAVYPFERYYKQAWTPIENYSDLERLRMAQRRAWLVYSFPEYMEPGLVRALHDSCSTQQVFPGTLGGGDVIVCTIAGRPD